jgi:hypothetical protein
MSYPLDFIITGNGRSGTLWLARMLNSDKSSRVHHELGSSYLRKNYYRVYNGELAAADFVKGQTNKVTPLLESGYWTGDVNSYLRFVTKELNELTIVIGLVRDGMKTVDSLYRKGCFQMAYYPPFEPPSELETVWERCCWYWKITYEWMLADTVSAFFRFEDLLSDWTVMKQLAHDYANVTVSKALWNDFRSVVVNSKDGESHPITKFEKESFRSICGDVQQRFDYRL